MGLLLQSFNVSHRKDGGLNKYPIHLAIMHNSDKCIQLITHHYYESYKCADEAADINDLHDYLMQNVLDYAIQYYPQISLRFFDSQHHYRRQINW